MDDRTPVKAEEVDDEKRELDDMKHDLNEVKAELNEMKDGLNEVKGLLTRLTEGTLSEGNQGFEPKEPKEETGSKQQGRSITAIHPRVRGCGDDGRWSVHPEDTGTPHSSCIIQGLARKSL